MKRLLLVVLGILFVVPAMSYAFTITASSATAWNAEMRPSGGMQTWFAVIKRRSDNVTVSSFTWTGITVANPGYKIANQYILVQSTVTNLINWRMVIYTDNTAAKAGFRIFYNDATPSQRAVACSTAAFNNFGLVGQNVSPDGSKSGLALSWMVLDVASATPTTPVFMVSRPVTGTAGFTNYMWKFLQDKGRANVGGALGSAWDITSTYVRIWDATGYYWNEDPTKAAPASDNNLYIYLGVDTTKTLAQFYTTKSLTIEAMSY
ncbi:MAG: hypothetical protein LHV68_04605 [Elusimicrobia bacterium]|nr:hypothetical protein [Candidatus Liberimonas magnetica]